MIMTHEEIIILAKEAGIIGPSPYVGARENQLLALERFALLVVADFLQRTGQYVTNDASREAAINAAHLAGQRAMQERAAKLLGDAAEKRRKSPKPHYGIPFAFEKAKEEVLALEVRP